LTLFKRLRERDYGRGRRIDVLQFGSAASRRRIVFAATVAVLAIATIPVVLALQQYDDAKAQATTELQARAAAIGGILDTYFGGRIAMLDAMAGGPAVVDGDFRQMDSFFRRAAGPGMFTGGIGWIDRSGIVRASSIRQGVTTNLSDRTYFRQVLATRSPYVSAGLTGRTRKLPMIVVAVPTFGPLGNVSGVLAGSIVLKTSRPSAQAFALGYGDVQIVDREGRFLLAGLRPVPNAALVRRMRTRPSGVFSSTAGLAGRGGHVVAFANSRLPHWVSVIDRPRSVVFAPARRALTLQLASVATATLLVLLILAFAARRQRREAETANDRARSWAGLSRALAITTSPAEVADALLASLALAFPERAAVVALGEGRAEPGAESTVVRTRRLEADSSTLDWIGQLARDGPRTVRLDRELASRGLRLSVSRRFRVAHCVPIAAGDGRVAGTISLLGVASRLGPGDWALLTSFADQATNALERSWRFQRQHELAVHLQRSLLPELLPSSEGAVLAGHYAAGADAAEVGGDWYAAVRRPDGLLQLCVGDVSGKGIAAATVMSRKRRTFEIYAHDLASPAEIVRRMLRHVDGQEMVTLAIVSLDLYTGELTYTRAGHPPPLLLDRPSGRVTRLDGAGSPPMGVAEPSGVTEERVALPAEATLVLYTDGLVERRGGDIDRAIDLLGEVMADEPRPDPGRIVNRVGASIGPANDDVALLVLSFDDAVLPFDVELPSDPAHLTGMRRRLRAWLDRRGLDHEVAADVLLVVSEACNNAIEHGYRAGGAGQVRVNVAMDTFSIRATVEDHGTWRDEPSGERRGRGLGLMNALMDSVDVQTGSTGTRVVLERRVRVDTTAGPEVPSTSLSPA
jgi:anti-sigma regulatory factor (Ser/Thr protein kinase)/GAF domain-containing protein